MHYQEILDFWFEELDSAYWFQNDGEVDQIIQTKFSTIHEQATKGELWTWRDTIKGRLAEIILLDQFSRNMFRGEAAAFANDTLALALAQEAIRAGEIDQLSVTERAFLYMPYMHAESLKIHEVAMELFQEEGMEDNLKFEIEHKKIIEQFGRYPHRNETLGRDSTIEEKKFLETHSGF